MPGTLLILSIDGLRPSDYLDPGSQAPVLKRLMQNGASSLGIEPIYPSVTSACHVSMVTGTYPEQHGISGNTQFAHDRISSWKNGESQDWYFDASSIRSPTLWQELKRAGKKVAVLRWPLSVGADVDWLVPEMFSLHERSAEIDWELLRGVMKPAFFEELSALPGNVNLPPSNHDEYDDWISTCASHVIRAHRPDVVYVHLISMDHEVHEHGTDSVEVRQALRKSDDYAARILSALNPLQDRAVVCGDHGFLNFDRRVHINSLLAQLGWLSTDGHRILDWNAIAHTNCGQAGIYMKDPARQGELMELLSRYAHGKFTILSRGELDRLRTLPDATFAIDANQGYSLGQDLTGAWDREILGCMRGEHGYLATLRPELHAGFIAAGAGIARGLNLGLGHLVDLAPTFARLMGVRMGEAASGGFFLESTIHSPVLGRGKTEIDPAPSKLLGAG